MIFCYQFLLLLLNTNFFCYFWVKAQGGNCGECAELLGQAPIEHAGAVSTTFSGCVRPTLKNVYFVNLYRRNYCSIFSRIYFCFLVIHVNKS